MAASDGCQLLAHVEAHQGSISLDNVASLDGLSQPEVQAMEAEVAWQIVWNGLRPYTVSEVCMHSVAIVSRLPCSMCLCLHRTASP